MSDDPLEIEERGEVVSTFWNGEPCHARRVTLVVADAENPTYWARHYVGTRRDAVEVVYGDQTFYLDDDDYEASDEYKEEIRLRFGNMLEPVFAEKAGAGWWKVTYGRGSPRVGHRDLVPVPGSVEGR